MNTEKLVQRKNEIIFWFKNIYTPPNQFPFFEIDGLTAKPSSDRTSLSELGDYLPFLLYCGENEYVENQINLARSFFNEGRLIMANPRETPHWWKKAFIGNYTWSFEYTDLILGLLECYQINKDKQMLDFAESVIDKVFLIFCRDKFISRKYYPKIKYSIPESEPLTGMFIELLVDFYRLTHEDKYLEEAVNLTKPWIEDEFFKSYGLFPRIHFINNLYKRVRRKDIVRQNRIAVLTKGNSTMIAGILALYNITKDDSLINAINHWVRGVEKYFMDATGGLYQTIEMEKSKVISRSEIQLRNLAIIDLLCDMYYIIGSERYLDLAKKIANSWLNKQSDRTGLIPLYAEGQESYFDCETDFVIALMKLYELSDDDIYLQSANRVFKGQLEYHYCENGYVDRVNIISEEITDYNIQTRFVSLFLKPILLFIEGAKIYDERNVGLYYLLRDR